MSIGKKKPMRQCVGCREMKEKKSMMRVLKTEEGIVLDMTGKRNGRGAYICQSKECLQKAVKNKGLERSLKTPISQEIYNALERELEGADE